MRVIWSNLVVLGVLVGCTSGKDTSTDQDTDVGQTPAETSDTAGEEADTAGEEADTADEDVGPTYTIWTGEPIVFEKPNFADSTDPENQDAITDLVVLTRGNRGSLFNVVVETGAGENSPEGTEWAKGTTADIDSLEFAPLKAAAEGKMKEVPDTDFVLHLIDEDIYIDVRFLSWKAGGSTGGGFSYQRSTQD